MTSTQAAPTPIPGGANQVSAISGKVGQTIFNGVLRIKIVELRDATPGDRPEKILPNANQKVMVMSVLLRNGAHAGFIDLIEYTLASPTSSSFFNGAVDLSGVEKGYASVDGRANQGDQLLFVRRTPITLARAHAAQSEG